MPVRDTLRGRESKAAGVRCSVHGSYCGPARARADTRGVVGHGTSRLLPARRNSRFLRQVAHVDVPPQSRHEQVGDSALAGAPTLLDIVGRGVL